MSRRREPEDWREMDGEDVLLCLQDNDPRCCVEGKPWIELIPNSVLADALRDVNIYHQFSVCHEAARRLERKTIVEIECPVTGKDLVFEVEPGMDLHLTMDLH